MVVGNPSTGMAPSAFAAMASTPAAADTAPSAAAAPPAPPASGPAAISCYPQPFGAVAALLAASLERAGGQPGASFAHVDVLVPKVGGEGGQQQQDVVLSIEDDAPGMSPRCLRRCLGMLPGEAAAGQAGRPSLPDFVHAALRLGTTALILSKRRDQGSSIGLLYCPPSAAGGSGVNDQLAAEVAALEFDANGGWALATGDGDAAPVPAGTPAAAAWEAALDTVCRRWLGSSAPALFEVLLRRQLAAMPQQGTRVLISGLHKSCPGGDAAAEGASRAFELDWASSASDICQTVPAAPGQQRARLGLWQRSLRAYMAVMFLRLPADFQLRLRGTPVPHFWRRLSDSGQWTPSLELYRPRGIKDEVDDNGFAMQHTISATMGILAPGAAHPSLQGICLYHHNRLVRPFYRPTPPVVTRGPSASATVGYLEADLLEPLPSWSDFVPCPLLTKLEGFLKRVVVYRERQAAAISATAMATPAPASPLQSPERTSGLARGFSDALPAQAGAPPVTVPAVAPAPASQPEEPLVQQVVQQVQPVVAQPVAAQPVQQQAIHPVQLQLSRQGTAVSEVTHMPASASTPPLVAPAPPAEPAAVPAAPEPASPPAGGDRLTGVLVHTVQQLLARLQEQEKQQAAMQHELAGLRQVALLSVSHLAVLTQQAQQQGGALQAQQAHPAQHAQQAAHAALAPLRPNRVKRFAPFPPPSTPPSPAATLMAGAVPSNSADAPSCQEWEAALLLGQLRAVPQQEGGHAGRHRDTSSPEGSSNRTKRARLAY